MYSLLVSYPWGVTLLANGSGVTCFHVAKETGWGVPHTAQFTQRARARWSDKLPPLGMLLLGLKLTVLCDQQTNNKKLEPQGFLLSRGIVYHCSVCGRKAETERLIPGSVTLIICQDTFSG